MLLLWACYCVSARSAFGVMDPKVLSLQVRMRTEDAKCTAYCFHETYMLEELVTPYCWSCCGFSIYIGAGK
ncbi:hypothetical protein U1Q18_011756, partial [Sarracenia purpurea var. burkii]